MRKVRVPTLFVLSVSGSRFPGSRMTVSVALPSLSAVVANSVSTRTSVVPGARPPAACVTRVIVFPSESVMAKDTSNGPTATVPRFETSTQATLFPSADTTLLKTCTCCTARSTGPPGDSVLPPATVNGISSALLRTACSGTLPGTSTSFASARRMYDPGASAVVSRLQAMRSKPSVASPGTSTRVTSMAAQSAPPAHPTVGTAPVGVGIT
jgi:hypothetical protein